MINVVGLLAMDAFVDFNWTRWNLYSTKSYYREAPPSAATAATQNSKLILFISSVSVAHARAVSIASETSTTLHCLGKVPGARAGHPVSHLISALHVPVSVTHSIELRRSKFKIPEERRHL